MGVEILSASLSTDEELHELIIQSLDSLLGPNNELIASRLPFDGNHILAIDNYYKPVVISYDSQDGGKALLSGIAALEKLVASRELFYSLYPRLIEIMKPNEDALTLEKTRLIILAPQSTQGALFLTRQIPNLSMCTFHALQINSDIGLFIESEPQHITGTRSVQIPTPAPVITPEFRTGRFNLNKEEELFFQEI